MSTLGKKIKLEINNNNRLIEEAMAPASFILNKEVSALLSRNRELQEECPHEFNEGYCIYCYKMEGEKI